MSQERRALPRYRVFRAVRLHRASPPQVIETLITDLAAGGMRCVTPTPLPVSTELSIELLLSDGSEPCMVTGRTIWAERLTKSRHAHLGVEFIDAKPRHQRRLSVYVKRLADAPDGCV